MGKIFPDGKAHFDPVTHKILKPDDWEEKYAPEPAIKRTRSPAQGLRKHAKQKEAKKHNSKKSLEHLVPNFSFLHGFILITVPLVSLLWRGEGYILRRIRPLTVRRH